MRAKQQYNGVHEEVVADEIYLPAVSIPPAFSHVERAVARLFGSRDVVRVPEVHDQVQTVESAD